jgi:hypothetical protein
MGISTLAFLALGVFLAGYLSGTAMSLRRRYRRLRIGVGVDERRVSALKPLRGLDPDLERNLESFARLDAHRDFEVLLLLDRDDDPAAALAHTFTQKYPERFRVIVGTRQALHRFALVCLSQKILSFGSPIRTSKRRTRTL